MKLQTPVANKFLDSIITYDAPLMTMNDRFETDIEYNDLSGNAVIATTDDTDESKEISNRLSTKTSRGEIPKRMLRVRNKKIKKQFRRGLTVKFCESDDDVVSVEAKFGGKIQSFYKSRATKRYTGDTRMTSDDSRQQTARIALNPKIKSNNSSIIESQKIIHPVTKIRNRKYKHYSTKKEWPESYKLENYFTQNWTPIPKCELIRKFENTIEDPKESVIPFHLQNESETDFMNKRTESTTLACTEVHFKPFKSQKTSFALPLSNCDVPKESSSRTNDSDVFTEGKLNQWQEFERKDRNEYSKTNDVKLNFMKQNAAAKKQCILKRSKSITKDEEYDTVIIEEYSYNSPKTSKCRPLHKKHSNNDKNDTFSNLLSHTSYQNISREVEKNRMMQTQKAKNIYSDIIECNKYVSKSKANKALIQEDKTDDIWNELDEVISRASNTSFIKIEKEDIEDIPAYKPNYRRKRRLHF